MIAKSFYFINSIFFIFMIQFAIVCEANFLGVNTHIAVQSLESTLVTQGTLSYRIAGNNPLMGVDANLGPLKYSENWEISSSQSNNNSSATSTPLISKFSEKKYAFESNYLELGASKKYITQTSVLASDITNSNHYSYTETNYIEFRLFGSELKGGNTDGTKYLSLIAVQHKLSFKTDSNFLTNENVNFYPNLTESSMTGETYGMGVHVESKVKPNEPNFQFTLNYSKGSITQTNVVGGEVLINKGTMDRFFMRVRVDGEINKFINTGMSVQLLQTNSHGTDILIYNKEVVFGCFLGIYL